MRDGKLFSLLLCVVLLSGCASGIRSGGRSIQDLSIYPRASGDADRVLPLSSNKDNTRFTVDGNSVGPPASEINVLVNNQPHKIIAEAPGYQRKESFIQPPYDGVSVVSFSFIYKDQNGQGIAAYSEPDEPVLEPSNHPKQPDPAPKENSRPPAPHGLRVALVIGNSNYKAIGELPNPLRDAVEVAKRLKNAGFSLLRPVRPNQDVQADLTLEEMRQADNALRQAAEKAEMVLLYYAGHGLQLDGLPYLVPINLPMPDKQGLDTQAGRDALASQLASLDELIKGLDEHTQVAVTIFDACREIPATRSMFGDGIKFRGLIRPQSLGKHRLLAFSAGSGELASDGSQHSPYAQAFMDEYDQNAGQKVTEFFMHIQGRMIRATGQTPEFSIQGDVPTEIYLKP